MHRSPHRAVALFATVLASATLAACGSDGSSAIDTTASSPASTTPGTTTPGTTTPGTTTPGTTAPGTTTPGSSAAVIDPGDGGAYAPVLDPADFVAVIDNPYLPMPVGADWKYEGESDGEVETVDITVTEDRKDIQGISAFVVRDTVTIGGELVEDTLDWFAQDSAGNVWYLGEDVKDYENGQVVSTAGSWEAGVDGAVAGIVMPAAPAVGDVYRQEFYAGEAEDMMEIIDVGTTITVAAGTYDDVVSTRDWSPLEPETIEEKSYGRGVGKLREAKTAGGDGFAELVEYTLGS